MNIRDLKAIPYFQPITPCSNDHMEISVPYCCDLLSVAMHSAPLHCVWCTVMNNSNTLAVSSLVDAACVIICNGTVITDDFRNRAIEKKICVFQTELPIFDAALEVYKKSHENSL